MNDPNGQSFAAESLVRGAVLALPTDTLYGFSAAISRDDAVRRIASIKHAPDDRRFIMLADTVAMVADYVASFGCSSREEMQARWPAPLTVILPSGPKCPAWVGPTVAIRIPAWEPLRAVIARVGEPVVSTSVNRTGSIPLNDAQAILREFGEEIDAVFERSGSGGEASTIVDLCGKSPRVIRPGAYAWDGKGGAKPSK